MISRLMPFAEQPQRPESSLDRAAAERPARVLTPEAQRALAEAEERRRARAAEAARPKEIDG